MKTPLLFAAAATVLVAALSGCTPTSASDSAGGGKAPKQVVTELDWGVHYAKCMRDKGHDFPDPKPGQRGQGIMLDEGTDHATYSDDLASCTNSVTAKYGERPVSDEDRSAVADDEKMNDCLRKNGVDVPDVRGGAAPALSTDDVPKNVLDECGVDLGPAQ